MLRSAALAGLSLALAACGEGAARSGPQAVALVTDSLGRLVGGTAIPSPDGTRIAFARTADGKSAIWVADADGGNPRRLSDGVWDFDPWWSADGKWIAYHAESPDFDAFVVSADSGAPRALTSGPAVDRPRNWLPDGSAVTVARSGVGPEHTLLVPLDGSAPRRLGPEAAADQHAALSPDGTKVGGDLHAGGGDGTIWVQDLAGGGGTTQLTTENLENAQPPMMWSPDSRFVAYTSRRTGTTDIWIADVNTGETRQLTTDIRNDHTPRWSPDGRWIAFLSDRGGQTDLWVMPAAGGAAERLTNDIAIESSPRWAPDGSAVYFGRNEFANTLKLLPLAGGAGQDLLRWEGYTIGNARLSPDGKTILFDSNRSGNLDLWSIPAAGGEPTVFAASPADDTAPEYSPDGTRVLFHSSRAGSADLWVAPAAGGEPTRLTMGPSNEGEAEWSPDGASIAFVSTRAGGAGDVWVIPSGGGEARRVTTGAFRPAFLAWSPDGRFIHFLGDRPSGGRELYRVPASGGRPAPLGAPRTAGAPTLNRDGSTIAFSTFEGGWAFLHLIPAAGGAPRRVTRGTERVYQPGAVWSDDGRMLAVYDLDLDANTDNGDLQIYTPADDSWRRLTRTPRENELPVAFTGDGTGLLVLSAWPRVTYMRIPVAELLAGGGGR